MVKGLTNDVNKKVGFFRKIFLGYGTPDIIQGEKREKRGYVLSDKCKK